MRILTIAQYFPPDIGGASTRASNILKGLSKRNCTITVLTAFPHYPEGNIPSKYFNKAFYVEYSQNMKIVRVWVPSLPHTTVVNRVLIHLCFCLSSLFYLPFENGFDIIWAANPNLFSFISAMLYGLVYGKPIVRNVDDLWPEVFIEMGLVKSSLIKKILFILAWLSYKIPVALTPISPGYVDRISEQYGVEKQKMTVIPVGVDPSLFQPNKKSNGAFLVMYSGILGPGYDFKNLLKSAALLKHLPIKMIIRGIGNFDTKIESMIKRMKLKNVTLETRLVSPGKLVEKLNKADVFLLPLAMPLVSKSIDAGLPTKIFEYQALRKPIICFSAGQSEKYIKETKSGIVVPPKDYKSFAEALKILYFDEELKDKLGENGYKYVVNNLTLKKLSKKMHVLFKTILHEI